MWAPSLIAPGPFPVIFKEASHGHPNRTGFSTANQPRTRLFGVRQCDAAESHHRDPQHVTRPCLWRMSDAYLSAAFFAAVNRLPLGFVSTIAFLGPLSVAVIGARTARRQALGLALVAGVGVALIVAPFASGIQGGWAVDPLGLGFALVAALGWALYIVLIRRVGSQFSQLDGLSFLLLTAAVLLAPTVLGGLERMPDMSVILMGAGLAILAPLLTCWPEMAALRKIGTQSFGIMMSLEPAIATVLGLVILHESPSPQQILGMACVILASVAAVVLLGRKPDLA